MRFINTLRKRGLALLLAVLMCLSMMPTGALAADDTPDQEHDLDDWNYSLVCTNDEADHVHGEECYEYISPQSNSLVVETAQDNVSYRTFSNEFSSNRSVFKDNRSSKSYTISIGEEITLTSEKGNRTHEWSSDRKNTARIVNESGKSATVKGIATGTATITHNFYSFWNNIPYPDSEEFTIHVTDPQPEGIKVYCYTLLPWADHIVSNDADDRWNGMGFGYITDAPDPKTGNSGDTIDIDESNFTPPSDYPSITNTAVS